MNDVVEAIRDLRKDVAGLRLRLNQTMVTGTIKEVRGDKVRLLLSEGEDGEVLTPWIRMAAQTGKRGQGVSEFTKYGVGEAAMVVSPNGEIGSMSAAMPWISTEQDPAPGQAEQDGKVIEMGDTKVEQKNGTVRITQGGAVILLSGGQITMTASQITINGKLQINGSELKHNAKSISDTHTHTGVTPGGGLTSIPS